MHVPRTSDRHGASHRRHDHGPQRERVRSNIDSVVARAHRRIVINLAGVSYVDSAGRGELLAARTAVAMSGGQIRLVNLTHRIDELLIITKLSTVFEICSDEHEALLDFH